MRAMNYPKRNEVRTMKDKQKKPKVEKADKEV